MTRSVFRVRLARGAQDDLRVIRRWMIANRTAAEADRLLQEMLEAVSSLEQHPNRGSIPSELDALGIRDIRQVFVRTFRLFYRVIDQEVVITIVADGRRDLQSLLERRLLSRP